MVAQYYLILFKNLSLRFIILAKDYKDGKERPKNNSKYRE